MTSTSELRQKRKDRQRTKLKKISPDKRIDLLVKFLKSLDIYKDNGKQIPKSQIHILLEQQWSMNYNSNNITNAIIAHYLTKDISTDNIHMIKSKRL